MKKNRNTTVALTPDTLIVPSGLERTAKIIMDEANFITSEVICDKCKKVIGYCTNSFMSSGDFYCSTCHKLRRLKE